MPRRHARTTGTAAPAPRAPQTGARILVTGFEPFAGAAVNASQAAVRLLPACIAGAAVLCETLPTAFDQALKRLAVLIAREAPTHVLCVGEAGGRSALSVERVAINVNDARIADNAGRQPIDTPVVIGGPAAYFATLPIKAMVAAMHAAGLPAAISNSAGTYVCNHVFYGLLHLAATRHAGLRAGFIHVPCLPAQAADTRDMPSMAESEIARGLEAAIHAALTVEHDLAVTGGTEA